MKDVEGDRPVEFAGQEISLVSEAQRNSAVGYNVTAKKRDRFESQNRHFWAYRCQRRCAGCAG